MFGSHQFLSQFLSVWCQQVWKIWAFLACTQPNICLQNEGSTWHASGLGFHEEKCFRLGLILGSCYTLGGRPHPMRFELRRSRSVSWKYLWRRDEGSPWPVDSWAPDCTFPNRCDCTAPTSRLLVPSGVCWARLRYECDISLKCGKFFLPWRSLVVPFQTISWLLALLVKRLRMQNPNVIPQLPNEVWWAVEPSDCHHIWFNLPTLLLENSFD